MFIGTWFCFVHYSPLLSEKCARAFVSAIVRNFSLSISFVVYCSVEALCLLQQKSIQWSFVPQLPPCPLFHHSHRTEHPPTCHTGPSPGVHHSPVTI